MFQPSLNGTTGRFFISALISLSALAGLSHAATPATTASAPTAVAKSPQVKFTTNVGSFTVEVYPDKAPKTVANFLQYVKDKHYDGTIFHRVIANFMIQGGGFDAKYQQKPTRAPIAHEGRAALAAGGPRNTVGTLAMARTGDPHSASAQFFINVKDNDFLDPTVFSAGDPVSFTFQGKPYTNVPRAQAENAGQLFGYTVFGKVIAGMETVEKIRQVPTGAAGPFPTDVPQSTITVTSAVILP